MIRFEEIKDRLLDSLDAIVADLVPDGKRKGKYWIGKNPTRADRHAGSFWVLLSGPAKGAWRDEAGQRGVDEGDIVALVRYCRRLPDMKETRAECLKLLGLSDRGGVSRETEEDRKKRDDERAARIEREKKDEAAQRGKNRVSAFKLWLSARPLDPATWAQTPLHRYLQQARGIDLQKHLVERRRPLPGALRWFSAHDYHTDDGEVIEGLPCMIALLTGADGKPRGVHRTWLKPDASDKAELPEPKFNKPRKFWPAGWTGGVVRIAKGAGQFTPEEAARRGVKAPLIVTEGIEDALTVAIALPDRRVWAAATLGNLRAVPLLPCVSQLTVCADNDWNKPQAQAELEAALTILRGHGRPVHVARSPRGKDFNDLLQDGRND